MTQPENLIFWGAGATAALGIRTTVEQGKFISLLAGGEGSDTPLKQRVADALGSAVAEPWHSALYELITILGDSAASYRSIHDISAEQMEIMRRNWELSEGEDEEEIKRRIVHLRLIYDWPALKSVVGICPGNSAEAFRINDLFNLLDMHIPPKFGVRARPGEEGRRAKPEYEQQFFDSRRLVGAKNALLLILIALFHIDYQMCLATKQERLEQYRAFAIQIALRAQQRGRELAHRGTRFDSPDFYQNDVGFVSLNYDPIGLWIQFIANRELNAAANAPHIGSSGTPLHLFHDFGHLIPARGVERKDAAWPWYPLNEAAAQRLNEESYPSGYRVRLTKFLFPHGSLCWRECPDCGKLSAYHGHQWNLRATGLFPPPPLKAFDPTPCPEWIPRDEREIREKGGVDGRKCLHCGTLTYAHHTQAVMQSSFKAQPPSFIEEIQRELRATVTRAKHIILMGYSLPPDDVTYRAFFSARRGRRKDEPVACTIVTWDESNPDWYGPRAMETRDFSKNKVVEAARDIFEKGNVRFYGGGVPNVFLDGGTATKERLEKLLNWSSTSRP